MKQPIRRRTFGQVLASAAGAISLSGDDDQAVAAGQEGAGPQDTIPVGGIENAVNVADVRRLAREKLPKATFDYIDTGSADQYTLRDNLAALQRIKVFPPLLRGVRKVDLSVSVLGKRIAMPIMLAPVAAQRMYHPDGGLAATRAAATMGTVYAMSGSVGNSVEEIAQASKGPKWFQLYVPKDRKVARQLIQRVNRAGFEAIIVTVDLGEWKDADRRNKFTLPKEMLVKHLRDIGFKQITSAMSNEEIQAFNAEAWDLSLSWDFFSWLRKQTQLPILIKGVLRPGDAQLAVVRGLDGIIVSNHGGRRLDGMPATIDMLARIVEVAGDRLDVYMDSGIRRGTDVLKALALGARAVFVGRPYAWGLGAAGEAGVRKVLELLRDELSNAMLTSGCARVADIDAALLDV
ncbi:MAG: alpha-hydroxy acid oxidase [Pirellulaceae bacterium]